ncbi:MAG: hypothetical protein ACE5E0_00395 [Terriglobia bacterium]
MEAAHSRAARICAAEAAGDVSTTGEPPAPGPPAEADEERSGRLRKALFIILLTLLLALLWALFWPVSGDVPIVKPEKRLKGEGIVGQTRYATRGPAEKVLELGGQHTTNWVLVVPFTVENLSGKQRILDYSHVKLVDDANAEYAASAGLTARVYHLANATSPWEKPLKPGEAKNVQAVFAISESKREFLLGGRDLTWTSMKFIELPIVFKEIQP